MKRINLLLTSVVLIISCTIFSFASSNTRINVGKAYVSTDNGNPVQIDIENGEIIKTLEPGNVLYFEITNANTAEDLNGLFARTFFDDINNEGSEFIESPSLEYRMLYNKDGSQQLGYSYVFSLPTKSIKDNLEHIVNVKIGLSRQKNQQANIEFKIMNNSQYADARVINCNGRKNIIEFSENDGYSNLVFDDDVSFHVETKNQGKIKVGMSKNTLTDVQSYNKNAKIKCFDFIGKPIFNKKGILEIKNENFLFIYEQKGVKLIPLDESYDKNSNIFVITTRRLGTYILSDIELFEDVKSVPIENPLNGE